MWLSVIAARSTIIQLIFAVADLELRLLTALLFLPRHLQLVLWQLGLTVHVRRNSFVDVDSRGWIAHLLATACLSALNVLPNDAIEALLEI